MAYEDVRSRGRRRSLMKWLMMSAVMTAVAGPDWAQPATEQRVDLDLPAQSSLLVAADAFLASSPDAAALAELQERPDNRVPEHLRSIVNPGTEPPPTPLERNGGERLTTYSELREYLQQLSAASPLVELRTIGSSREGREIQGLFFSRHQPMEAPREEVLTVLISCQQHGNEPSGKEAALQLARNLIVDDSGLLDHMDLILVPQVNPDGAEAGTRRNAADMDLNRNHTILSEPEVQALHGLFLDWMPQVTLDVHETNVSGRAWRNAGFLKDPEEQLGGVSNLNIAPEIHALSSELMIPEVGRRIRAGGVSFHEYVVGGPPEERRLRFSTTDINDSRQSMGIYNTLSFLFEGKRWDDYSAHIGSRTNGQVMAMKAFLATVAANAETIKTTVTRAREDLLADGSKLPPVHIRQDYGPDPERPTVSYPIFDLKTWSSRVAELDSFEPKVSPVLSVARPWGYAVPAEQMELVRLLERHRIRTWTVQSATPAVTERYEIEAVSVVEIEDKEADEVTVKVQREQASLPAGTLIVPLRQPAGNLIPLLLEPQSLWAPYGERGGRHLALASLLQVGTMFPVMRILEPLEEEQGTVK